MSLTLHPQRITFWLALASIAAVLIVIRPAFIKMLRLPSKTTHHLKVGQSIIQVHKVYITAEIQTRDVKKFEHAFYLKPYVKATVYVILRASLSVIV